MKFLLHLGLIFILYSCSNKTKNIINTQEDLAKQAIISLIDNNYEHFKSLCIDYEILKTDNKDLTLDEYNESIFENFQSSLLNFKDKNINLSKLTFNHCDLPYKSYQHYGNRLIRYYAYFNDEDGNLIKVRFSDCVFLKSGLKMSESLIVK